MPRRLREILILIVGLGLASSAAATQLKIATLAPDGSFWMTEVAKGADEISQRTGGRVTLRLYPGGTMGNDQAVLRKMRIGQLQGGMVTSQTLATISSDLQVYGLPLVFRSYDEVDAVRKEMDPDLIKRLDDKGFVSFGLIEGGFAYIMSNEPAKTLADFKGQKAWAPEGDVIAEAVYAAASLSPVPLPLSDVLTGLQTGLIDTVAGPPVAAVALQWFTRTKYLTDLPILYSYGSIIVSKKVFSTIDPADQQIVREVLGEVTHRLDTRTRTDNLEAWKALVKQGMQVVTVDPSEVENWQKVADEATAKLKEQGRVPADLTARMDQILAAYRQHEAAD